MTQNPNNPQHQQGGQQKPGQQQGGGQHKPGQQTQNPGQGGQHQPGQAASISLASTAAKAVSMVAADSATLPYQQANKRSPASPAGFSFVMQPPTGRITSHARHARDLMVDGRARVNLMDEATGKRNRCDAART